MITVLLSATQQRASQTFAKSHLYAQLYAQTPQATRRASRLVSLYRPRGTRQSQFGFTEFNREAKMALMRSSSIFHPTSSMLSQPNHQTPYIAFIADFVAFNKIEAARALLATVPESQRVTGDLAAWTRVLAEPRVTPRHETTDRTADLEWLRQHSLGFANQWVALRRGELLASGKSLPDVLAVIDRSGGRVGVLVHQL